MKLLQGIARKLSLPLVAFSACGWLLFVVGFAAVNLRDSYYNALREGRLMQNHSEGFYWVNATVDGTNQTAHRAEVDFFPYWCFLIAGPFLYIFTFLHLLIGRCLTGILPHFLTALCLACGGAVIYTNSLDLFSSTVNLRRRYAPLPEEEWLTDEFWGLFPLLEWVGCVTALVFLALYMMMWPMFSHVECRQEKCRDKEEEEEKEESPIMEQPVEGEELKSPTE